MVIGIYTVYVHNGKVYVMPALTPQWVEFDVNNKLYENIEQLKDYKLNINIETKGKEAIISFDYINASKSPFLKISLLKEHMLTLFMWTAPGR